MSRSRPCIIPQALPAAGSKPEVRDMENEKSLQNTPAAVRTHIGFFGRMNAGKSSLINALADQPVSIVSEEAGTTTDVVKKTMEIHGIGPCVLLDTAGFDDVSKLGAMRTAASRKASMSCDIAVIICGAGTDYSCENEWLRRFAAMQVPAVVVLGQADTRSDEENRRACSEIERQTGIVPLAVSAVTGEGKDALLKALVDAAGRSPEKPLIMGNLVRKDDVVILVMPQDPQAPEGRLILPEVQTIREALDRHCICLCVQPDELPGALAALKEAPALIVTDSQVFDIVHAQVPEKTKLTSFSILFAGYKGDIDYYIKSTETIADLTEDSRILIAECCTHAPLDEDIGRVKIPAMLRKRIGSGLTVDVTAGNDFPEDAGKYNLIIQCGGCMLNRRAVMSRINQAKEAQVPMTN